MGEIEEKMQSEIEAEEQAFREKEEKEKFLVLQRKYKNAPA